MPPNLGTFFLDREERCLRSITLLYDELILFLLVLVVFVDHAVSFLLDVVRFDLFKTGLNRDYAFVGQLFEWLCECLSEFSLLSALLYIRAILLHLADILTVLR